jgi:hypothetical protein
MGVLSIFLGIFGIIFGWIPLIQYFALALSVLGIVFSAIALKKASASEQGKGKGAAIIGLVLCVIGTVCSGIGVFVCTVCTAAGANAAIKAPEALQGLQDASNALQGAQNALENLTN